MLSYRQIVLNKIIRILNIKTVPDGRIILYAKTEHRVIGNHKFVDFLTPSPFSVALSVLAGIVLTATVVAAFMLSGVALKQQLSTLENTDNNQPALTLPGEDPPGTNQNSLQNTWPLMAFWAFLGLISYYVVNMFLKVIHEINEYNKELDYVNARRDAIIKITAEYFLFRLFIVLSWLIFTDYFLKHLIPLCILAAHAATFDLSSFAGIASAVTAFLVMAVSIHIHAVFLRLAVGRPRILSPFEYTDSHHET